jgi:hypothetical protein
MGGGWCIGVLVPVFVGFEGGAAGCGGGVRGGNVRGAAGGGTGFVMWGVRLRVGGCISDHKRRVGRRDTGSVSPGPGLRAR